MNIFSALNLNLIAVKNFVMELLSADPGSPTQGRMIFNTTVNAPKYWNGTAWRYLDAAFIQDGSIQISGLATNPLVRGNHTGTQVAATISDLATTVRGYSLDTFTAPAALMNFNSQRLTNQGCSILFSCNHDCKSVEASESCGVSVLRDGIGLIGSEEIVGETSEAGEDAWVVSDAGSVLAQCNITCVMEPVLDTPMPAYDIGGQSGRYGLG